VTKVSVIECVIEVLPVNDLKGELMFYISPDFLIKNPSGALNKFLKEV
jgi:hypothetical protein